MKVLILKRDKIGDLLLTTPMFAHLKRSLPGAELHVLANDYNAWVVENNRDIDRLWVYPRFKHGARLRWSALLPQILQNIKLRRERFDFAVAAGGLVSPRAVNRILGLGARRTVAFSDGSRLCRKLSDPQVLDPALHEVDANLRLLLPIGVTLPVAPILPKYDLPAAWRKFGASWVAEQGLLPGRFIVIGLNARKAKRKPTRDQILYWSAEVMRRHGLETVLMWQPGARANRIYPGDDEIVPELLKNRPPHLHPFRHEESVLAALGVIWQSCAAVFPDGGIAHLASVSPAGVLSLFAETDVSPHPDNWRPVGSRATYLEAKQTVAELADEAVLSKISHLVETYVKPQDDSC